MKRATLLGWMLWLLLLLWGDRALGQDRFVSLAAELDAAVVEHPGLDETVELSVGGVSVADFVRAIGLNHKLNLSVDPNVKGEVVNNFSNARVADVLLYLCKHYALDLEFIGTIIALRPYSAPAIAVAPPPLRPPGVMFRADSALLDLDLRRDRLDSVATAITTATGRNVILAPGLEEQRVSVFLRGSPVERAIENLAFANGLALSRGKQNELYLSKAEVEARGGSTRDKRGQTGNAPGGDGALDIQVDPQGLLDLHATDAPLSDLIEQVSRLMERTFYLRDRPDTKVTIHLTDVDYPAFLTHVLAGTDYTHELSAGVHVIGKRDAEGLRGSELVRLENRTITDVLAAIPDGLKKDLVIQEFKELNGLVLSGSRPRIEEIKQFLRQIDQPVPLVTIEVLIVDVKRSRSVTTGISAGVGGADRPTTSGGTILPGANYNLTAPSLNQLINSFNGLGVVNLGNVKPDFYLSIQALETDGQLKLRSTPQLSTLNGHEATLSIGETAYYLEVRNDIIGTQNPTVSTSQIFKPITADLSVKILPIVSRDDMVTLDIEVNQSDFTERISNTAPPGSVERKFKSIIRVKNREMIALGGLEEKEVSRSGRGLPLIARIPVLKWIFGSRSASNRRSKLTLFIRPTVIY